MVESFYRLLGMTRRRHGYSAPPLSWFKNLVEGFGERLTIRVAAKSGMAVAAILSLTFKDTVIYKYGGSDADHHCSGAMPMLFWSLIQDAKAAGIRTLDLGRSDLDNPGLIAFKDRWGARQSQIVYRRFPLEKPRGSVAGWGLRTAKQMFARMPDSLSRATGKLLYRHVG
jgi:lipid II:glycine glycyltransferase (peptidoglycan interpeptide bridge formation enzyme)